MPKTGSADSLIVISRQHIPLKAGRQVLRIVAEKGDFNLDYLTVEKEASVSVLPRTQDPLVIYPNPFMEKFTLRTDADGYLLRVMDFQGRTRLETILHEKGLHTLGEDLPPGLYLVNLIGETGSFNKILMKAR